MATDKSFFLAGDCKDLGYRNVRDNPDGAEAKAFVESLWSRYHDLADPHFRQDSRNHFHARFWEMYLAVTLRERRFELKRVGDEGPEFYVMHNGRKIWVEAVAPGPGEGNDRVPAYRPGEVTKVPVEKILLRFTNALAEKRNKYWKARGKGIINPNDLYLLAINSRRIPHAPFGNTLPFFVQAFLPFGPLACELDIRTNEIVDTYYQLRENIEKESEALVSTTAFLNPEFSFVSAVLHSGIDCADRPVILGQDFMILYNPTAVKKNRLDPNVFHWCQQILYQDGHLEFRPELK
jgi:hypothetical protein